VKGGGRNAPLWKKTTPGRERLKKKKRFSKTRQIVLKRPSGGKEGGGGLHLRSSPKRKGHRGEGKDLGDRSKLGVGAATPLNKGKKIVAKKRLLSERAEFFRLLEVLKNGTILIGSLKEDKIPTGRRAVVIFGKSLVFRTLRPPHRWRVAQKGARGFHSSCRGRALAVLGGKEAADNRGEKKMAGFTKGPTKHRKESSLARRGHPGREGSRNKNHAWEQKDARGACASRQGKTLSLSTKK